MSESEPLLGKLNSGTRERNVDLIDYKFSLQLFVLFLGLDTLINFFISIYRIEGNSSPPLTADFYCIVFIRVVGVIHSYSTGVRGVQAGSIGHNMVGLSFLYLTGRTGYYIYDPIPDINKVLFYSYISVGFIFTALYSEICQQIQTQHARESFRSTLSEERPVLPGLDILRFFAAIHIVIFHYYKKGGGYDETASVLFDNFAVWGGSQLTFFFLLSGFVLSYQYSQKCSTIDTATFWLKRFARVYPSYLFSIIAMILILPISIVKPLVVVCMVFCVQAWSPDSIFSNPINVPGWFIGAILFLYLIFPFSCRIISATHDTVTLWYTCLWFWLITPIVAATIVGRSDLI